MQVRAFCDSPTDVSLMDGTVISYGDIVFDTDSYHFTYQGRDITNSLPRSVKLTFPSFDQIRDNYRLDAEFRNTINQPGAMEPLPTDVTDIFATNLSNEVKLGAGSVTRGIGEYVMMGFGALILINILTRK